MAKNQDTTAMYILAIVLMVAAVGMFTIAIGTVSTSGDIAGAATYAYKNVVDESWTTAPTYTGFGTCLDKGDHIELAKIERGRKVSTLVKRDTCTGPVDDKRISRVSCVLDRDGSFSYKYSLQTECPFGTVCMKGSNGAAYCG